MKIKLALFASGSGTNVENIARYFAKNPQVEVQKIYCNKANAFVLERAKNLSIPSRVFSKDEFTSGIITQELQDDKVDFIILAGFLWLIPASLVKTFSDRIINIHPSLLPKYGGKGMYGHHVHEAVVSNKEKESGISIHLVNEEYDKGEMLFQAKTTVTPNDTPDDVAAKIHELEQANFPRVIEEYILKKGSL